MKFNQVVLSFIHLSGLKNISKLWAKIPEKSYANYIEGYR